MSSAMSEVDFSVFWPSEIFFSHEGKRVGGKVELWTVASLNDRKLKTFILDGQMVCWVFKIVFEMPKSPGHIELSLSVHSSPTAACLSA